MIFAATGLKVFSGPFVPTARRSNRDFAKSASCAWLPSENLAASVSRARSRLSRRGSRTAAFGKPLVLICRAATAVFAMLQAGHTTPGGQWRRDAWARPLRLSLGLVRRHRSLAQPATAAIPRRGGRPSFSRRVQIRTCRHDAEFISPGHPRMRV